MAGGMAAFSEETLVPTASDDPLARWRLAHARRHSGDDLGYGPGVVELDLAQHATGRLQMIVSVDQPRDDGRSAKVLDARRPPCQGADLIAADRDKSPISDGQRRCRWIGVIDRMNCAVDEYEIRGERVGRAGHRYLLKPARAGERLVLLLQMGLEEPEVFVQLPRNLGKEVSGVLVTGLVRIVDGTSHGVGVDAIAFDEGLHVVDTGVDTGRNLR